MLSPPAIRPRRVGWLPNGSLVPPTLGLVELASTSSIKEAHLGRFDIETGQEKPSSLLDFVSYGPDVLDVFLRGVVEFPVDVTNTREESARVAASHGDDNVG